MKRKGFSLITAIIFIVMIATICALALSLSTQTSKQTTDVYLRVQAELLSRSATEFALLALQTHNINEMGTCINQINMGYPSNDNARLFDIGITLNYIGNNLPNTCNLISNNITTDDSNVTIVMDTIVTSFGNIATEPIRIHKRTLQKP